VLLFIALLGQRFIDKLQVAAKSGSTFKKVIGALFIIVGIFIATGLDKKLETWVLDTGYFDITQFESRLLERVNLEEVKVPSQSGLNQNNNSQPDTDFVIPSHLARLFPNTNWTSADPNLKRAMSGGPGRDGIPAIDSPKFIPLKEVEYPDSIQAIVLKDKDEVKVYPYNILTWHEIVNDTVGGVPVAVTFCPLCGSAITFKRETAAGVELTLGVSGSLLESNMIMFDRETESLWQQSTGKTLAGELHESKLELFPMQLLTIGEIKNLFPNARIMSEDTGHNRDYTRNPYAGYENDERFAFEPSSLDRTLPLKEIVVAFKTDAGTPVAIPWLDLRAKGTHTAAVAAETFTFKVTDTGELTITDQKESEYPFYFEMWFSFAAQHAAKATLLTLK
jgi:hypothetical protein